MSKKINDLQENLGTAAHLINGSSENRFKVTYCPGLLTKKEIEGVNFSFANLDTMMKNAILFHSKMVSIPMMVKSLLYTKSCPGIMGKEG